MNFRLEGSSRGGLLVAALVALSACSRNDDVEPAPIVMPPTTISGTASKGLVKQARVLVCRIVNGAPEPDAACATGTTGQDGSYSVTLGDGHTGPAIITVTTGTASMMLDETTARDIPYEMTMRSIVPAIPARAITYVTPFSEMAVSGSITAGLDAERITITMTQTQTLLTILGVDLSVKPMIDLQANGSDAVALGKQANMVKQLARVTMAAKNSDILFDGGVACNAPGTSVTQQVACTVRFMSRAMAFGGLPAASSVARVIQALLSQTPTSVTMPIIQSDGTLVLQWADMTSAASMQTAMQNAGMTPAAAAAAVPIMMQQMR